MVNVAKYEEGRREGYKNAGVLHARQLTSHAAASIQMMTFVLYRVRPTDRPTGEKKVEDLEIWQFDTYASEGRKEGRRDGLKHKTGRRGRQRGTFPPFSQGSRRPNLKSLFPPGREGRKEGREQGKEGIKEPVLDSSGCGGGAINFLR